MNFTDLGVDVTITEGLAKMGFEEATPIQEQAIPKMLEGMDIVGLAQTGTGKTAAFGIPLIQNLRETGNGVQALVLAPTRELAVQNAGEIEKMAAGVKGLKILAVYGGAEIGRQFAALRRGVDVVIGTPGRVLDHMRRGTLNLENVRTLVLDEADEMLDMGFREDIETVLEALPENHQTALFSATMADQILELTKKFLKDPEVIEVSHDELTVSGIKQSYYVVKGRQKDEALCRLIDYMSPKRSLIFCNTKRKVEELTVLLKRRGYSAEGLHGDLVQQQRDRVMELFRNGGTELLLATDVAARGIDVDDVDIVFNYDLPQEMEYYVHRIGRTGRNGKKGKAVSLVNPRELHKIEALENYCSCRIKEKVMPSFEDVLPIKSKSTIDQALAFTAGMDLSDYRTFVEKACAENGLTPTDVAAAFLRASLGEEREKIDIIGSAERKKGGDRRRSQGGRDRRRSGDRRSEKRRESRGRRGTYDGRRYGPRTDDDVDFRPRRRDHSDKRKSSGRRDDRRDNRRDNRHDNRRKDSGSRPRYRTRNGWSK